MKIDPIKLRRRIADFCAIPSISQHPQEENAAAKWLHDELSAIKCHGGNTLCVRMIDCEGDAFARKATIALLRAGRGVRRTVLLTGHFDVVSPNGPLAAEMFDIERYTQRVKSLNLPEQARIDAESGDWLFGRGIMDMKAGLCMFISAMELLAADPDLAVNIVFLGVPDEEANSDGMRGTISPLRRLIEEEKLDMVAALTGEPCFWTAGEKPTRPYYTGTTGKIMPFFMAVGKAAHVDNYCEGVNAALLAAEIVSRMEGAPEWIEGIDGATLAPPVCLTLQTRRDGYSVTLPERAVCYFNVLTISRTPLQVLELSCAIARQAATAAMARVRAAAARTAELGRSVTLDQGDCPVITVSQLRDKAIAALGGKAAFDAAAKVFSQRVPAETDAREVSVRFVEWMIDSADFRGPAIVCGFVPPYYPYRLNHNRTENERRLRSIITEKAQKAAVMAGDGATSFIEVFGGITDLSFLGFEGQPEDLLSLSENMAGWGRVYSLPVEDLLALDVPIANMGPAGRDAHKETERMELRYSLEIAPQLLLETIRELA